VCNNLPFAQNHIIEVVNRETNYTVICPVKKSDTDYPQYHLTKPWYAFIKNMQVQEKEANKQGKGKGEQQLKLSPPITKRPCPEANKQGKGCTKLIDFVDT
jgi:hypothetical protein